MAPIVYFKSLIWLIGCGGLGYTLLQLTSPSESKIADIKSIGTKTFLSEDEKQKQIFMQKLKEATNEKPIYLQRPKTE